MPISGSAARRYAEALLALAPDERAVAAFRASLEKLAPVFDRATVAGLRDPAVPLDRREETLTTALADEPPAIRSVLLLLLERDRIALVPHIARAFGEIVDRRQGIARARVTTAVPIDDGERAALVRKLEEESGRKIRATFAVDPALIGGAKVQIGDHLVDTSLHAKLTALGRELTS
jgi:F-type H+-transporting ATPase subunit delta